MALSFTDYTLGDPITPNVNYKVALSKAGDHAYLLTSAIAEATLQLTLTAPTDEEWSNVETYVANGPIAGRIFPLSANTYYFRVVGPPSLAYDSTLAIKDLDLEWPTDITPTAIPTDGTPITSGFYSLDALSLEVGKFHSFSIVPAKSGNLVGKHETSDQHRFVATIFGVDAQGFPVSHMTSFANMEQSIFNFDTAKAILHLSAPESAEFNYTCSIASFSSGSGDSLTPSSDATITGAWSFTNITVPTPTQAGQAANKSYVDNAVSGIGANFVTLDTEQTISGNKTFTGGIMKTGSPSAPSDLTNKLYVDGQIAPTVKNVGNQNVAGVKTFTDGVTMADEAPLTFGVGADAVKFHGTGAGMSVIEGGTGTHLDVAVSTTFQEPTVFQDATTFSTMIKAEKGISFGITEGSSASIYSDSSSNIMIEGSAAGRTLLNQALRFPTDSVFDPTTGVNIETGDARYLKFVSTTKAAYTALATKDPTTIYLITDTTPRMWAIGDMEIVTADVPALSSPSHLLGGTP